MPRITSAAIKHLKKDNSNELAETHSMLKDLLSVPQNDTTVESQIKEAQALSYLHAKLGRLYAAQAKELAPNETE